MTEREGTWDCGVRKCESKSNSGPGSVGVGGYEWGANAQE